jgi:riboflavin kinase/FMN adenylyltransferase
VKIYHELFRELDRPIVLGIGFFDGFHRGHQAIARATLRMRKPGWRSGVLTFAEHPSGFLRPGSEPPMIATLEERIDLLAAAGFEECFVIPFDERIASLAPQAFLERLVDGLGARGIAVGANFRFGHKRAGDITAMAEFCAAREMTLAAVENVVDGDERISSTRIRALIADGRVDEADRLLGHGYELRGTIELGAGRGHDLGFPTANLRVPAKLLPKDGVYSATARYDGRDHAALVSIGTNPQFGGTARTVEAWMRDFHETIYGREVALRDLRYVREQRLFAGVDELIAQMRRDLEAVAYPSFA